MADVYKWQENVCFFPYTIYNSLPLHQQLEFFMIHHDPKWIYFFPVLLFITWAGCQKNKITVYDGFEGSELSKIWSTGRMELHSFEIQSKIVRSGNSAAKITLRTGDVVEAATNKDKSTERDELQEHSVLFSIEKTTYVFQFSIFLPDTFPIVPTRLVLAQWKQYCPTGPCSNYSPVLALRYRSGKMFITLQTDSIRHTLWELKKEIRNQWLDFMFQVRFSRNSDGEVLAFLNGTEVVQYKGVTSYPDTYWYFPFRNRYYFKMGLYRDRMAEPMSMIIDDYKKTEIPE
jgi:hypothetical protein